jgi:hypothetical protein
MDYTAMPRGIRIIKNNPASRAEKEEKQMKWQHIAGMVALFVVGYLASTWYPQPGLMLKSKLGM